MALFLAGFYVSSSTTKRHAKSGERLQHREESTTLQGSIGVNAVKENESQSNHRLLRNTAVSGIAILLVFLGLFFFSGSFDYSASGARPILLVVGLLLVAAILAFLGLGFARQIPESQHKKLMAVIFGLAVSIRLVALFSTPILEIDYYRYIWDGKVVCEGVSPYRYSPAQVLESRVTLDLDLNRVANLAVRSESNHTILSRVHFENYTTLYPPVSQLIFAATMKVTPEAASVDFQVIAMKIAMTLFDLGIMLLVWRLLFLARMHPGWLIAYAWNPLVIKEIANSGHLDSIAAFFLVLTLYLIVRYKLFPGTGLSRWLLVLAGLTLGLGVGAKLFPAVLFPAFLVTAINGGSQFGKRLFAGAVFSVAFAITSSLVLLPMFYKPEVSKFDEYGIDSTLLTASDDSVKSQDGFGGFFSSWRMNDPIFSTIYFNVKNNTQSSTQPWFVVTTKGWRTELDAQFRSFGFDGKDSAFTIARMLTLGMFSCFYLWQLTQIYFRGFSDRSDVAQFFRRVTSILALFLILQPTVNPWYFVWVAPLICLTDNRGWILASGFLMLYYSRFWFQSLVGTFTIGGHNFDGVKLFDHCFVFVEFGLIVAVLFFFSNRKYRRKPDRSGIAV